MASPDFDRGRAVADEREGAARAGANEGVAAGRANAWGALRIGSARVDRSVNVGTPGSLKAEWDALPDGCGMGGRSKSRGANDAEANGRRLAEFANGRMGEGYTRDAIREWPGLSQGRDEGFVLVTASSGS